MEDRGLIFIPDISGFTQFVTQTDIQHSRLIIQELLEILINANEMGLEISEVEGDAILFYKFGEAPALGQLYKQVEKMFCEFHRHLSVYDLTRFCQCKACQSAINLTLKVITHYGEFTGYHVRSFNKLIGKDVIVAHQLLKNDIDKHEYWLVTKSLLHDDQPADFKQWMQWDRSAKQTESGEIPFLYTQLSPLKKELPKESPLQLELTEKAKMFSVSKEFDTDIIRLFHATGDVTYRSRWQKGVKAVEEVNHFLPRVGMRSRHILENGEMIVYASSYSFSLEKIVFSETDEGKKVSTYFTLEKVADKKTRLTVDYYMRKNSFQQLLFNLFKKGKMMKDLDQSLMNLERVAKEIRMLDDPVTA